MTIIQAQPLKQFGISGPASALDNEIAVFDGVTGKKIKAATGIICPSSGRLDLAEIRAKDGNGLKLYEDGGAGIFVKDGGNVGIGTENPLRMLDVDGIISTGDLSGSGELRSYQTPGVGGNYISVKTSAPKSGIYRSNTDFFVYYLTNTGDTVLEATFGNSDILFKVQGTTKAIIANNGNVGIGTISPATSAKLDLTSTTGALLLTRMTTAQRDALTALNGMILYNLTINKIQTYENGAWANLI